ncbi:MAG: response regulator transcription factor [Calditrichia bacterium]|nr:response regulator transcription factor [Calditrichia bacterium]
MEVENNKKYKILLVEDEETLAIGLEYNLTEEGYEVDWAVDGKKALIKINESEYDLIVLDVMLPYVDGFEVAAKVREKYPQLPILFLTARTGVKDKIKGLEIGADDYLTKPFHLKEMLLRVKGMLKRQSWYKENRGNLQSFKFGSNEINFENLMCKTADKEIQLTSHEANLMKYFIDNKGIILSREELLKNVWKIDSTIETRTVDNFIARLRKYFELDPDKPIYIKSVRGAGYIFSD